MSPLLRGLGKGQKGGLQGPRRLHLVVVQLLFSEDGLLVPHGDRGGMGGRGRVSRPFECCFPSEASGAPSPAPAALASPGAGSVASLAWPAPLGPAVQWEGFRDWEAKAGSESGAGLRRGAEPEDGARGRIGAEAQWGKEAAEVPSPWGQRPAQVLLLQHIGMAKWWLRRAA